MITGPVGKYYEKFNPFGNHPTLSVNLQAYWSFTTLASSLGGSQYTLTAVNGDPTFGTSGPNGTPSITMTGSQYVEASTPAGQLTTDVTIVTWVKVTPSFFIPGLTWSVFTSNGAAGGYSLSISTDLSSTTRTGSLADIYFNYVSTTPVAITRNAWHMLMLYVDAARRNVSVSADAGAVTTSTALTYQLSTASNVLRFGNQPAATLLLGGTGIWSRSLTSLEIASLYNSGNGLFY